MSDTENKYVKKISNKAKEDIINSSVANLSAKPTLSATEMKMRFVMPIVNKDGTVPSIADEIDRVATEADAALQEQEKTVLKIESDLGGVQKKVSSMEDEITGIHITLSPIPSQVDDVNRRVSMLESEIKYEKVSYITASIDSRTYVMTLDYYGEGGFKMGSTSIDLPLESMVIGAEYNKDTKSLILTLKSGESLSVPLEDVFAGGISSLKDGKGNGSVQQNNYKSATNENILGAIASGEGSAAFGGQRFDKVGTDKPQTEAKGKQSFASGGSVVVEGDWSAGFGKDTKTYQRAAFAEGGGTVAGNQDDSADNYSFAHAEGEVTKAIGRGSHAEGCGGEAHGFHSHVEGVNTRTTTSGTHAEGIETVAGDTWENWVATNPDTTSIDLGAFEYPAHAEGYKSQATGYGSHAEGGGTQSKGKYAHAEGEHCEAIEYCTHAEGYKSQAKKQGSHAEGGETIANGVYAHTEGYLTEANEDNTHAEGALTKANGPCAHAEGFNTSANGYSSHAGGRGTIAGYDDQTVIGRYNDNKENNLFEVGNGDDENHPSNAFEVDKDGNAYAGGTRLLKEGEVSGGTKFYKHTIGLLSYINTLSTPLSAGNLSGTILTDAISVKYMKYMVVDIVQTNRYTYNVQYFANAAVQSTYVDYENEVDNVTEL